MSFAEKILIVGGVLNIAYGLLIGIPVAIIRLNSPTYSKYLRVVHIGALMWGPILISLSLALVLSTLDESIELVAAWLIVIASILLNAKDTINWLMGTNDEFAEKPRLPILLGGLSSIASIISILIISVGVIQSL